MQDLLSTFLSASPAPKSGVASAAQAAVALAPQKLQPAIAPGATLSTSVLPSTVGVPTSAAPPIPVAGGQKEKVWFDPHTNTYFMFGTTIDGNKYHSLKQMQTVLAQYGSQLPSIQQPTPNSYPIQPNLSGAISMAKNDPNGGAFFHNVGRDVLQAVNPIQQAGGLLYDAAKLSGGYGNPVSVIASATHALATNPGDLNAGQRLMAEHPLVTQQNMQAYNRGMTPGQQATSAGESTSAMHNFMGGTGAALGSFLAMSIATGAIGKGAASLGGLAKGVTAAEAVSTAATAAVEKAGITSAIMHGGSAIAKGATAAVRAGLGSSAMGAGGALQYGGSLGHAEEARTQQVLNAVSDAQLKKQSPEYKFLRKTMKEGVAKKVLAREASGPAAVAGLAGGLALGVGGGQLARGFDAIPLPEIIGKRILGHAAATALEATGGVAATNAVGAAAANVVSGQGSMNPLKNLSTRGLAATALIAAPFGALGAIKMRSRLTRAVDEHVNTQDVGSAINAMKQDFGQPPDNTAPSPTTPEPASDIVAQLHAVKDGTKKAVILTPAQDVTPEMTIRGLRYTAAPDGHVLVTRYNGGSEIRAEFKKAVKAGTLSDVTMQHILGYGSEKTAAVADPNAIVVRVVDEHGNVIHEQVAALGHLDEAKAAAAEVAQKSAVKDVRAVKGGSKDAALLPAGQKMTAELTVNGLRYTQLADGHTLVTRFKGGGGLRARFVAAAKHGPLDEAMLKEGNAVGKLRIEVVTPHDMQARRAAAQVPQAPPLKTTPIAPAAPVQKAPGMPGEPTGTGQTMPDGRPMGTDVPPVPSKEAPLPQEAASRAAAQVQRGQIAPGQTPIDATAHQGAPANEALPTVDPNAAAAQRDALAHMQASAPIEPPTDNSPPPRVEVASAPVLEKILTPNEIQLEIKKAAHAIQKTARVERKGHVSAPASQLRRALDSVNLSSNDMGFEKVREELAKSSVSDITDLLALRSSMRNGEVPQPLRALSRKKVKGRAPVRSSGSTVFDKKLGEADISSVLPDKAGGADNLSELGVAFPDVKLTRVKVAEGRGLSVDVSAAKLDAAQRLAFEHLNTVLGDWASFFVRETGMKWGGRIRVVDPATAMRDYGLSIAWGKARVHAFATMLNSQKDAAGEHLIVMRAPRKNGMAAWVETFAHEMGHVTANELEGVMSATEQRALYKSYHAWSRMYKTANANEIMASRKTPVRALKIIAGHDKFSNTTYAASYTEWMADNIARWMLSDKMGLARVADSNMSATGKMFRAVANTIKFVAHKLSKKYNFEPDIVVSRVLDNFQLRGTVERTVRSNVHDPMYALQYPDEGVRKGDSRIQAASNKIWAKFQSTMRAPTEQLARVRIAAGKTGDAVAHQELRAATDTWYAQHDTALAEAHREIRSAHGTATQTPAFEKASDVEKVTRAEAARAKLIGVGAKAAAFAAGIADTARLFGDSNPADVKARIHAAVDRTKGGRVRSNMREIINWVTPEFRRAEFARAHGASDYADSIDLLNNARKGVEATTADYLEPLNMLFSRVNAMSEQAQKLLKTAMGYATTHGIAIGESFDHPRNMHLHEMAPGAESVAKSMWQQGNEMYKHLESAGLSDTYNQMREYIVTLYKQSKKATIDEIMAAKGLSGEQKKSVIALHQLAIDAANHGDYFPKTRGDGEWLVRVHSPWKRLPDGDLPDGTFSNKKAASDAAALRRIATPNAEFHVEAVDGGDGTVYTLSQTVPGLYAFVTRQEALDATDSIHADLAQVWNGAQPGSYDKVRAELKASGSDTVQAPIRKSVLYHESKAVPQQFARSIDKMVSNGELTPAGADRMRQMYLDSLVEGSFMKTFMHDRNVLGGTERMLEGYAQRAVQAARYAARGKYKDEMQAAWKAVDTTAREADQQGIGGVHWGQDVNFLRKQEHRDAAMYDNSPALKVARWVSDITTIKTMALSPSYIMIQALQPWMTAHPLLAGIDGVGYVKAGRYLHEAMGGLAKYSAKRGARQFGQALDRAIGASSAFTKHDNIVEDIISTAAKSSSEADMLRQLGRARELDFNFLNPVIDAVRGGEGSWRAFTRASMAFNSSVEARSRIASALAAYRVGIKELHMNHADAVGFAEKITNSANANYSQWARAAVTRGKLGLTLGKFQVWTTSVYGLFYEELLRSIKGDTPEIKAQARRTLAFLTANHIAAAGVNGLGIVGAGATAALGALTAAGAVGASDKYAQFKDYRSLTLETLTNWLTPIVGEDHAHDAALMAMEGITAPWLASISQRVGLPIPLNPEYWGTRPTDTGSVWLGKALIGSLGPVTGTAASFANAVSAITSTGDWGRAAALATPSGPRGLVRAYMLMSRGSPSAGKPMFGAGNKVSALDIIDTALGVTSPNIQAQYDQARTSSTVSANMRETQRELVKQLVLHPDSERLRARVAEFNAKVPSYFRVTAGRVQSAEKLLGSSRMTQMLQR